MNADAALKKLLLWHIEAGADEAVLDHPINHYHAQAGKRQSQARQPQTFKTPMKSGDMAMGMDEVTPAPASAPRPSSASNSTSSPGLHTADEALHDARNLARSAENIEELTEKLRAYEGCGLKKTATNMVFGDGNPEAHLMFVGEAPGADEAR